MRLMSVRERIGVCCVNFASFDVVCNEHSDGVRYVGVYGFVNEFRCIHSAICLAHVKCFTNCMCWLKAIAMVLFL